LKGSDKHFLEICLKYKLRLHAGLDLSGGKGRKTRKGKWSGLRVFNVKLGIKNRDTQKEENHVNQ